MEASFKIWWILLGGFQELSSKKLVLCLQESGELEDETVVRRHHDRVVSRPLDSPLPQGRGGMWSAIVKWHAISVHVIKTLQIQKRNVR